MPRQLGRLSPLPHTKVIIPTGWSYTHGEALMPAPPRTGNNLRSDRPLILRVGNSEQEKLQNIRWLQRRPVFRPVAFT